MPKRSTLEASRRGLSEYVSFGIGTIGTLLALLAPSWLSSNRPWKTAAGGCGTHNTPSTRYPLRDDKNDHILVLVLVLKRSTSNYGKTNRDDKNDHILVLVLVLKRSTSIL